MSFTEQEAEYLGSQRLARIATVAPDGQPDVTPVGFEFDGTYFYVGGMSQLETRKYHNVRDGNDKVAIVIDDVVSADPWTPRFVRVYGVAQNVERVGQAGPGSYLRITPVVSWSWNLDGRPFGNGEGPSGPRRTVHVPG
ncbi:MAG TPA: PPOX class F420-dependent oxidoreductase [Acidimicrobiia bacterium]|jgi:pyridoxamine 5'-phosphate oxidase family protein|nr:PPOX class F420-dependent oxidoreductase [Acidimicrobiia bacterium]